MNNIQCDSPLLCIQLHVSYTTTEETHCTHRQLQTRTKIAAVDLLRTEPLAQFRAVTTGTPNLTATRPSFMYNLI
jgi:hypothetical protein